MSTNDPTGAHGPGHDDHVPPSSGGRPDGPPDPGRTPGPGWTPDAGWTPGWQTEPPAQSAPGGAGGYAGGAGGWQTPPSGQAADGAQVPPWSPTAPPPAPSGHGFFESLRHSGWYRGDQRVLGGVCSGIAARTGWDVGLIRAVTVVLGLFLGPVWVAYGAAWALLPEQADGRIHLEQLTRGRYDVAQLGALVMVLLGLGNLFPWFLPDGSGWFLWSLALVAAITVVVIIANTGSRNRGYPPSAPWQGTPGAYGSGVPGTGSSSWQTPPAWQPGPAQQGSARPGAA
uniref:PspC domain-containing protein n=1 Tax=Actinomyces polynesiensis TaxID=1325934 RepID=UPI0011C94477